MWVSLPGIDCVRQSDTVCSSGGSLWRPLHWDLLRGVPRVGTRVPGRGRLPAQPQGLSPDLPQHPLLLSDAALPVLLHLRGSREPQRPGERLQCFPQRVRFMYSTCFSVQLQSLRYLCLCLFVKKKAWDGPRSCTANQKILQEHLHIRFWSKDNMWVSGFFFNQLDLIQSLTTWMSVSLLQTWLPVVLMTGRTTSASNTPSRLSCRTAGGTASSCHRLTSQEPAMKLWSLWRPSLWKL